MRTTTLAAVVLGDLGPVDGPVLLVRVRVDRSVWSEEVFRTLTG